MNKAMIASLIRSVLIAICAPLAVKYGFDGAAVESVATTAVALTMAIWGVIDKSTPKAMLMSALRSFLIAIGTPLAVRFGIDGANVETVIGAVLAISAAGWGVAEKKQRSS